MMGCARTKALEVLQREAAASDILACEADQPVATYAPLFSGQHPLLDNERVYACRTRGRGAVAVPADG